MTCENIVNHGSFMGKITSRLPLPREVRWYRKYGEGTLTYLTEAKYVWFL